MPENEKLLYNTSEADATEQKIIEAFIAGDREAFKYVYNKYRERIFSYCFYVTGNKAQAEDAFQEVFIRVYQKHEQLRETKAVKNWLLQIARSVCLNLTRESVFTPEFIYLDEEHNDIHARLQPLSELQESDFPEEIFQLAFNKIAPMYRDAFLLREIEGFSLEEVAELTATSVVNVKVRVMRAKRMLRGILAPHFKHQLKKNESLNTKKENHNDTNSDETEKILTV